MNRQQSILVALFSLVFLSFSAAQNATTTQQYIDQYKSIAVSEMERTGIPASILLAEGIIHSKAGLSDMSKTTNNHFHNRCSSSWTGKSVVMVDDNADDVCYRVYLSPEDSYVDHCEILALDPHLKNAFSSEHIEYKQWARYLTKAKIYGPSDYEEKLISLIDDLSLFHYDSMTTAPIIGVEQVKKYDFIDSSKIVDKQKDILTGYGVQYTLAKENETLVDVAHRTHKGVVKLAHYNEKGRNYDLVEDEVVYTCPKLKEYNGPEAYHLVRKGETIRSISQLYGVLSDRLLFLNRLKRGQEPLAGQVINLKTLADEPPLLQADEEKFNEVKKPAEKTYEKL